MLPRRLRLDCRDGIAQQVADVVASVATETSLDPHQAYRLRLAVDELTTNIAMHGYRGRGGPVELEAGFDRQWVWLVIEDEAPAFDPRDHDPGPAVTGQPQEGGYGIFLALNGVDRFDYDRIGGRNRSTLLIRRSGAPVVVGAEDGGTDGGQDRACRR